MTDAYEELDYDKAKPDCRLCGGLGWTFKHEEWCEERTELCWGHGHQGDCNGETIPCECLKGVPV
jgi:hypothetical protein